METFTSNSSSANSISLNSCLKDAIFAEVKQSESGYIFTDEFLASEWNNIDVHPESLPVGEAVKGMRKVTSPVLLLKSHCDKMAFILASEESPVYISSSFKFDKIAGYTMLFNLMPNIWPEYFFYLSKYRSWTRISHNQDDLHRFGIEPGFSVVGTCYFDGYRDYAISAETVFRNGASDFHIPSLTMQRQQINDAKMMEQILSDKMSEKVRKYQQKEWLNEAHIRNSKHRLSNDVMPVRMAIERLVHFLKESTEGITSSSIIGHATQQTVEDLLNSLQESIHKIETDIDYLTKSENAGEQAETIDVVQFIENYRKNVLSTYGQRFAINIHKMDDNLKIKISPKSFNELLDNVISNAIRHGFTDFNRTDYKIVFNLSKSETGYCKIEIGNNGNPLSERGRKEYFVRGSFAGETGHTGIGGARIHEIGEEFNGKITAPYSLQELPVVISVEFPNVSL